MTEFRDIPLPGRIIIIAIAVGVFAVAGVAVATSYNAIYRLVSSLDLYGQGTNKTFGMMLDVAFIIAELAAILAGILRAVHLRRLPPDLPKKEVDRQARQVSRGWPLNVMLVCGTATIAFNVFHAYLIGGAGDSKTVWRCVVAAFPPVLMILSFQVLIAITKWVMLTLGRPLNSAAALSPVGYPQMPSLGAGGAWAGTHPYWSASRPNPQIGQLDSEDSKADATRAYLRQMPPQQLALATKKSVARDMRALGVPLDETWAQKILSEPEFDQRSSRNGNSSRKR